MKKHYFITLIYILFTFHFAHAESHQKPHNMLHGKHHLSTFLGATHLEHSTAFTQGLDYEYRVDDLIGLGSVIEYASGDIDALTVLAVADIHFENGLILQVGPGFEFAEEDIFVARIGALYEFEFDRYTLSPQLHYDDHAGSHDGLVFGLATGFTF